MDREKVIEIAKEKEKRGARRRGYLRQISGDEERQSGGGGGGARREPPRVPSRAERLKEADGGSEPKRQPAAAAADRARSSWRADTRYSCSAPSDPATCRPRPAPRPRRHHRRSAATHHVTMALSVVGPYHASL